MTEFSGDHNCHERLSASARNTNQTVSSGHEGVDNRFLVVVGRSRKDEFWTKRLTRRESGFCSGTENLRCPHAGEIILGKRFGEDAKGGGRPEALRLHGDSGGDIQFLHNLRNLIGGETLFWNCIASPS